MKRRCRHEWIAYFILMLTLLLGGCMGGDEPADQGAASDQDTEPVGTASTGSSAAGGDDGDTSAAADGAAEAEVEEPAVSEAPAPSEPLSSDDEPTSVAMDQVRERYRALKHDGRFDVARNLIQKQLAGDVDRASEQLLQRLLVESRDLVREAQEVRPAIDALEGGRAQRLRARKLLMTGGEACRILLTKAVREGSEQAAAEAASLIILHDHYAAFDDMLARYHQIEDKDTDLATNLARSMRYMAGEMDADRLRPLVEQVHGDRTFAHRFSADLLLLFGDDAAVDEAFGAGTADMLIDYIERAAESDDAAVVAWAYRHATRADLGLPGFTVAVWHEREKYSGEPASRHHVEAINFTDNDKGLPGGRESDVSLRFTAKLRVPRSGRWTFTLNSDDGSHLFIDGEKLIDNGGYHGMEQKSGIRQLEAGRAYDLRIDYVQGGGGWGLEAMIAGPDQDQTILDGTFARTRPVAE